MVNILAHTHKSRLALKILLCAFLFALLPQAAQAARTVTNATVNGGTSVSVVGNTVISARVYVTTDGTTTADRYWRSTAWRIGNSGAYTCADHGNFLTTGNHNTTFNITAPNTVGTYSVYFIAYNDNSCSGGPSNTFMLSNAVTVTSQATVGYNTRDFELRRSLNLKGDVKVIGNSVLCKNSGGNCVAPGLAERNNDITAMYADIDGDASTFTSASANLSLPAGSRVLWARLYWQGRFPSNYNTDRNTVNTVKFKTPGGTYQNVVASHLDYASDLYYQAHADITGLINATSPNGDYFVADLTTRLPAGTTGAYGAWALAIIYENSADTLKNITIYDGFKALTNSASSQTIDVSGFRTPLSGTIDSTFFIFAGEGDQDVSAEGLQIRNGSGTFVNITNALNPLGNPFNSNLTDKGVYVTARNPDYQNTIGIDIDTYDVSNILGNNQTSTQIRLLAGQNGNLDYYYVGALGFATQIYSPAIGNFDKNATVTYTSNMTCDGKRDLRGATINYILSFENVGNEAASNVRVYDDFGENGILDYLEMAQTTTPLWQRIFGDSTAVSCDKNATAVYCDFNRITIGTKFQMSFSLKIKENLLATSDINLENVANARYYNAATGELVNQLATSNVQMAGGICYQETCARLKTQGITTDGYYIIDPDRDGPFQAFEIYCKDMATAEPKDYLPLIMTTDNSNFVFTSINDNNYYHGSNGRNRFSMIRINPDYTIHNEFLSHGFSSINLMGTSFGIDFAQSSIGGCDTSKLRKGYFDQAVRIDPAQDSALFCTASKIQLKQLPTYRYIDREHTSCRDLKTDFPALTTGHYYINPEDNRLRPFVTYCDMDSGDSRVSSIQIVLDGNSTTHKQDITLSRVDTCSQLGMHYFVPVNQSTFNKIRSHLFNLKPEWEGYTGTINEMVKSFRGSAYNYYLQADGNRIVWPYGPFGLYNPVSGDTGGRGKRLNSLGDYNTSMASHGWRTIFSSDDLGLTNSWWISSVGCGSQEVPLCSESGGTTFCYLGDNNGYSEPNGNYTKDQWLNYVVDSIGNVYHCDDSNNNVAPGYTAEYVYTSYTCMTLDSYGEMDAQEPKEFDAWETVQGAQRPADPRLYTRMIGDSLVLRAGPADASGYQGSVCVRVIDESGNALSDRICLDFNGDSFRDFSLPSLTGIGREARINIRAIGDQYGANMPDNSWSDSNSSDTFAIRPVPYTVSGLTTDKRYKAGEHYENEFALTTSTGYTQGDGNLSVTWTDEKGWDKLAAKGDLGWKVSFVDGTASVDINYTEVGKLDLNITDMLWTAADQPNDCIAGSYATTPVNGRVGCLIGTESDGLIGPQLQFVPDKFIITRFELANANGNNFTYYAESDSDHNATISLDIRAVNKQGIVTQNYSDDNYSKEVTPTLDFITPPGELQSWTSADPIEADSFKAGESNATLGLNFTRTPRTPLRRLVLPNDGDLSISLTDTDEVEGTASGATGTASFYYGRFFAPDVATTDDDAIVRVYTEIYCPSNNCGYDPSDNRDWQRINDATSIAELNSTLGNGTLTGSGSESFSYSNGPRPKKFPIHLSIPPYLWHHPFGQPYQAADPGELESRKGCYKHPCVMIEFLPDATTRWGGTETDTNKRRINDETETARQPQRLGW